MEKLNLLYDQYSDLELVYCIFEDNVEMCQFSLDENNEFFIVRFPTDLVDKFNTISYNNFLEIIEGHKVLVIKCFNS
jgi:hypothetical protein